MRPAGLTGRPSYLHLYRGAPAVRAWSKYQETVTAWTLCGVRGDRETSATEDAGAADCPFCKILLREGKK